MDGTHQYEDRQDRGRRRDRHPGTCAQADPRPADDVRINRALLRGQVASASVELSDTPFVAVGR